MTHSTTQQVKTAYCHYLNSRLYTLRDCYERPSYNKERAFDYCLELVQKYNGRQPRIIGYNTMQFSFGFIGSYDGNKPAFFYITRDYDRYINLDELEG